MSAFPQTAVRWIDTTGGPHILMAAEGLAAWTGVENWDGDRPDDPSDYGRACRNGASWLGLTSSAHGDVVVLGGDVGPIAWFPTSDTSGAFVQWIGCEGDDAVLAMLAQRELGRAEQVGDAESILIKTGVSGRMVLIDASAHGQEVGPDDVEQVRLRPGRYRLEAYYVETATCMAVVREVMSLDQA